MSEQTSAETVPADVVRCSLDGCLSAPAFRRSPKLAAFLTYIVEEELAGRGEGIKAYTIATQALRRSDSFDPSNDPSVRVEAGRLRRVLDEVFTGEGRRLPVRILVPVGAYRPIFEVQPSEEAGRIEAPVPGPVGDPVPASSPGMVPAPAVVPEPAPALASLLARGGPVPALFETRGQAVLALLLALIAFLLAVEIMLQIYVLAYV
ncbi:MULTISPECIES: hypothetical protein [Methylobacterium]|uniref:hypothetical protein n=1 Tax=Methylobacterium TaxID=407 RepID=UPI0013EBB19A|nr:hypothetical protein [Methylobacterium sp. DB0501]NGM35253.1 hypothetical protein [Methylobacterium sp. DB0501]